jgi:uncharacterized protein YukE
MIHKHWQKQISEIKTLLREIRDAVRGAAPGTEDKKIQKSIDTIKSSTQKLKQSMNESTDPLPDQEP